MAAYSSDEETPPSRRRHRSSESPKDLSGSPRGHTNDHNGHRKTRRSPSRDEERPRKRRSLTPETGPSRRYSDRRRARDRDYEHDRKRDTEERSQRAEYGQASPRHHHRKRDEDDDRQIVRRHSGKHGDPRSKSPFQHRRKRSPSPRPFQRSTRPLPPQQDAFDSERAVIRPDPVPDKQQPNYAPSGRLAAASNTIKISSTHTIVLKYHEPSEARKPPPSDAWRLYIFKDSDILDTLELSVQSCWLFGREEAVCDVFVEHPSISAQHCVLQFRYVEKVVNEWGEKRGKVRLYVIDLESKKGTWLNGRKVEEARYTEIRDGDVLRLGESTREYVLQLPPKEKGVAKK